MYLLLAALVLISTILLYQDSRNATWLERIPASPDPDYVPPFSVVICVHNEEQNLRENLPKILEQKATNFEVVVVDDHSTDHSQSILKELQSQYPELSYHKLRASKPGKKHALHYGIKAAKYQCIVLTDADCQPASKNWARRMAATVSSNDLALGYAPILKENSLLNWLVRWETFQTALLYLSAAARGKAYMGVGRNMAYRKSIFWDDKARHSHEDLRSGDDDLLVNALPKASLAQPVTDPDTFVFSKGPGQWTKWWKQKIRHHTTSFRYSGRSKFYLASRGALQLTFWFLIAVLLCIKPWAALAVVALRFAFSALSLRRAAIMLQAERELYASVLLEPVWTLAVSAMHLKNLIAIDKESW